MFIITEFGIPHVAEFLTPLRPDRLAAMKSSWKHCKAFDGTARFEPVPDATPSFSALQRFLAHTVSNPPSGLIVNWRITGDCSLAEIIAEVEAGLEKDDDMIQQWFGADDVLKLLRSATTFGEMADRVRCICGEFETDERLQQVVDAVLGRAPE